ncbi:MAG TPA: antibiotic biosynthesis monooxygenase family protein [Acidimicrobiia bacterium]|nr:antibiotic biosynthesis monooxygenase family protein [Acidimicrobiia bacterium]
MIAVVARYRVTEGKADEVARELATYAEEVRTEPGCVTFVANRGIEDDHEFVLYEVYEDRDALDAHVASEHYEAVAVGRIRPLLADRQVTLLTPL